MTRRSLYIPILAAALAGCAGGDADTDPATPTGPTGPTMAVSLPFDATVDGTPAACATGYDLEGVTAELADARLFLSELELRVDGEWQRLWLDDNDWQNDAVALLDFEDGTAACADSGTAETNDTVTGEVAEGDAIDAVRFVVGVPFENNHLDSATAPAPQNTPGMFWAWQSGYKFLRVDWAVDGADRWNIHLGATGCVSDAPTQAPASECGAPNRATIELPFADGTPIEIDLAALVDGADLTTSVVDSPPGCMSSPVEPDDCAPVFANLGLDFTTGTCATDCTDQGVFR